MIHHSLKLRHHKPEDENVLSSAHWGVSKNDSGILIQIDDGKEQVRIKVTPEEAMEVAIELIRQVQEFNLKMAIETCR